MKLLQDDLHNKIEVSKPNYYSRITCKLTQIQKKHKSSHWALLKAFLNNKKIPLMPPLFHGNEYVTDFKKKSELFNSFFAKQCSLINSIIELPLNLHFTTEKRLDTLNFCNNDIENIIQDFQTKLKVMIYSVFAWLNFAVNQFVNLWSLFLINVLTLALFR